MRREAQAKQRRAREYEFRRNVAEVSDQLKDSDQGSESEKLFISIKARIKRLPKL